jgi:hypothetical protein
MSPKLDRSDVPTVSQTLPDGTAIELLYDPEAKTTCFAIADPDGDVRVDTAVAVGDRHLIPYSPHNNLIATGCIVLPSDIGDFGDKPRLLAEVRGFLHRYVALSPLFEEIAAHYVLLTWVYDSFNELPYLRFRGDFGTGKTRALLAVGSLCYKGFFASGASTVSPIFHVLDAFRGTLILDEADFRFSDATADLTKVLNNGNVKGLPILRTMANRYRELNPRAFRVYGPKIVAMRREFEDEALESRFLTEETGGGALRADIPIQLPDALATEARELRNKLLRWRFSNRLLVGPDPSRLQRDMSPRLNQTALALLSIVDDNVLRDRITAALIEDAETLRGGREMSVDAALVRALLEELNAGESRGAAVGSVAKRLNEKLVGAVPRSGKWVGWYLRTRLGLPTVKSHGVFVVSDTMRPRIEKLASQLGLAIAADEEELQDS